MQSTLTILFQIATLCLEQWTWDTVGAQKLSYWMKELLVEAQRGGGAAFSAQGSWVSPAWLILRHWCLLFYEESLDTVIKCECASFLWEISCHSEVSTVSILVSLEFQHKENTEEKKNTSTKVCCKGQVDTIWGRKVSEPFL